MKVREQDLRCRCSRSILLARYGTDTDGQAYIRIRVRKNARIITNTLHKGGSHDLWCSECHRVTRIHLTPRGSKIIPPTHIVPALLSEDGVITLPETAQRK